MAKRRLIWNPQETPADVAALLQTLSEEYRIGVGGRGIAISFAKIDDEECALRVSEEGERVRIEYSTLSAAARGVAAALAGITCEEKSPFGVLGIMLDVSRGMVMKVSQLKRWLRRLALAGYNQLQLYAEDVYALPGEPFFGRHRGAYTLDELREVDKYAATLGIEVVGCLETLGHLEQLFHWDGAYGQIKDTSSVVMVDDDRTYELIEKMIAFWAEALGTRRIHIGMDETHDLGRGRFMDIHGAEDAFQLFNRHLTRTNQLCEKNGLRAMIWSDMYFRLGNPERQYYRWDSPIPQEVQEKIPKNVQLVYWDYYNTDENVYRQMLQRHRDLGYEPVMGSGIWTWARMWFDYVQTMKTVVPCINVCREMKVKEFFFTMWGDDGAYCCYDSALAGIVRCGDLAYGADPEEDDATAARYNAICMADYNACIMGSMLYAPVLDAVGGEPVMPSQIIWDDPLMCLYYDECRAKFGDDFVSRLIDHYEEMLFRISPLESNKPGGDLVHLVTILDLSIKKLEMQSTLLSAYQQKDKRTLRQLAVAGIPTLIAAMNEFDAGFRRQWLECAKPQGLETIQVRNGGQIARLNETARRIKEFIDGEVREIPELEEALKCQRGDVKNFFNRYRQVGLVNYGV